MAQGRGCGSTISYWEFNQEERLRNSYRETWRQAVGGDHIWRSRGAKQGSGSNKETLRWEKSACFKIKQKEQVEKRQSRYRTETQDTPGSTT